MSNDRAGFTAGRRAAVNGPDRSKLRWQRWVGYPVMCLGGLVAIPALLAMLGLSLAAATLFFPDRELATQLWSSLGTATFAFGAAIVPYTVGRNLVRDARVLDRFMMEIHCQGITVRRGPGGRQEQTLAWQEIRHIVLTGHRPGRRRLQIDIGHGPEPDQRYAVAGHRLLFPLFRFWRPPYQFALDLPVDRLSRGAEEVCRLIQHASRGRFPDLGLPAHFPTPAGR